MMKRMLRLLCAVVVVLAVDVSPWLPPLPIPSAAAQNVNTIVVTPSAAGSAPSLSATGSDSAIGITIVPKGTGGFAVGSSGTAMTQIKLFTASISPASTGLAGASTGLAAAASGFASQTFTVSGVAVGDHLFLNLNNLGANVQVCRAVAAIVTAANSVKLIFAKPTTASCTPTAGLYAFIGFRD